MIDMGLEENNEKDVTIKITVKKNLFIFQ